MATLKLDLLIIEVKDNIAYAFSREELKLYRFNSLCYPQFEIGTFISCDVGNHVDGVFGCSGISKRAASPSDQINLEDSTNGPILVMKSYMIFNRNQNARSFRMESGFSDWYGYIRTTASSLRKKRGHMFVLHIVVDDLEYENKKQGCLFRHYEPGRVGKKYDLDFISEMEQKEIEFNKPNSIKPINPTQSKTPILEECDHKRCMFAPPFFFVCCVYYIRYLYVLFALFITANINFRAFFQNIYFSRMSKKSVEHRLLTLWHDLDNQHLYGFNKVQRSLMVVQIERNKKIRVGSTVSFIVLSISADGIYTPEIGSVNIDQFENDIINSSEDNLEIKTFISFSNCPNHFTHAKQLAFSDLYGFIDVKKFDINFQANYIYETVIRIKQFKNKDLPCFEAIKSPTVSHNFTNEDDFIRQMNEFENERVEKSRQNMGNVFNSDPQFERRSNNNPYYTRDNRNHNQTKSIVRFEYLQMLVIKVYDRPKNGVFGVATCEYGDVDLNVTSDHSGTLQLKVGDWFRGVLDKKKNNKRLVVEKIETLVDCLTDFRVTPNDNFIALTDLDLVNLTPSKEETTIYKHDFLYDVIIERKDYDLIGKRVYGEILFIPNSQVSWKLIKYIEEIPRGVAFMNWKQNYDNLHGHQSKMPDSNNQEDFRPPCEDDEYDIDDIDNIKFTPTSSRHPPNTRKDDNEFHNMPSFNESRGYRQNYPPEDDERSGNYNGSQYQRPQSQNIRSDSRTGSEFSQSNGYGKENSNSTQSGSIYSDETIYANGSCEEMGVVTEQLGDEGNTFIVYSSNSNSAVFYRLIPGSRNARLGEFFEFRSRRIDHHQYKFEVTEVIKILNPKDYNPIKIMRNMVQVGVVLILNRVDLNYMANGKFVVTSEDIGQVVFGENIDVPGQKHLSSEQLYEKYRTSPVKMMCFCQFEYGPSIDDTHDQYRWVLQACEGSYKSYLDKQLSMENRNLGNSAEYREDDDIAQAKRRNAENSRNPSYMNSGYSSRVNTPMSEQIPRPESTRQPTEFASSSRNDSRNYHSEQVFDDSRSGRDMNGGSSSPASSANVKATPREQASSCGSYAGGTEESDYKDMYNKLRAESRKMYKITDLLMKSNVRQQIKKHDTEMYEELESCLKKMRDMLSTTKKQ